MDRGTAAYAEQALAEAKTRAAQPAGIWDYAKALLEIEPLPEDQVKSAEARLEFAKQQEALRNGAPSPGEGFRQGAAAVAGFADSQSQLAHQFYGDNPNDTSAGAQTGRALAAITGLTAAGVAPGAAGVALGATQASAMAYADTHRATVEKLKQEGETDPAKIAAAADLAATDAAGKAAAAMTLYMGTGRIAGEIVAPWLKEATPFTKGLLTGTASAGGNVAASTANRFLEAAPGKGLEEAGKFTLEGLITDTGLGFTHGAHFYSEAKHHEAVQNAYNLPKAADMPIALDAHDEVQGTAKQTAKELVVQPENVKPEERPVLAQAIIKVARGASLDMLSPGERNLLETAKLPDGKSFLTPEPTEDTGTQLPRALTADAGAWLRAAAPKAINLVHIEAAGADRARRAAFAQWAQENNVDLNKPNQVADLGNAAASATISAADAAEQAGSPELAQTLRAKAGIERGLARTRAQEAHDSVLSAFDSSDEGTITRARLALSLNPATRDASHLDNASLLHLGKAMDGGMAFGSLEEVHAELAKASKPKGDSSAKVAAESPNLETNLEQALAEPQGDVAERAKKIRETAADLQESNPEEAVKLHAVADALEGKKSAAPAVEKAPEPPAAPETPPFTPEPVSVGEAAKLPVVTLDGKRGTVAPHPDTDPANPTRFEFRPEDGSPVVDLNEDSKIFTAEQTREGGDNTWQNQNQKAPAKEASAEEKAKAESANAPSVERAASPEGNPSGEGVPAEPQSDPTALRDAGLHVEAGAALAKEVLDAHEKADPEAPVDKTAATDRTGAVLRAEEKLATSIDAIDNNEGLTPSDKAAAKGKLEPLWERIYALGEKLGIHSTQQERDRADRMRLSFELTREALANPVEADQTASVLEDFNIKPDEAPGAAVERLKNNVTNWVANGDTASLDRNIARQRAIIDNPESSPQQVRVARALRDYMTEKAARLRELQAETRAGAAELAKAEKKAAAKDNGPAPEYVGGNTPEGRAPGLISALMERFKNDERFRGYAEMAEQHRADWEKTLTRILQTFDRKIRDSEAELGKDSEEVKFLLDEAYSGLEEEKRSESAKPKATPYGIMVENIASALEAGEAPNPFKRWVKQKDGSWKVVDYKFTGPKSTLSNWLQAKEVDKAGVVSRDAVDAEGNPVVAEPVAENTPAPDEAAMSKEEVHTTLEERLTAATNRVLNSTLGFYAGFFANEAKVSHEEALAALKSAFRVLSGDKDFQKSIQGMVSKRFSEAAARLAPEGTTKLERSAEAYLRKYVKPLREKFIEGLKAEVRPVAEFASEHGVSASELVRRRVLGNDEVTDMDAVLHGVAGEQAAHDVVATGDMDRMAGALRSTLSDPVALRGLNRAMLEAGVKNGITPFREQARTLTELRKSAAWKSDADLTLEQLCKLDADTMEEALNNPRVPETVRILMRGFNELTGDKGLDAIKRLGPREAADFVENILGPELAKGTEVNLLNIPMKGQGLFWSRRAGTIIVNPLLGRRQWAWTAIHETVHALTGYKIDAYLRGRETGDFGSLTGRELEACQELDRLLDIANAEAQKRMTAAVERGASAEELQGLRRDLFGTHDAEVNEIRLGEFVSEAMNHEPFQKFLEEIIDTGGKPGPDTEKVSIWKRVLNALLVLVRQKPVDMNSLLQKVWENGVKLANNTDRATSDPERNAQQAEWLAKYFGGPEMAKRIIAGDKDALAQAKDMVNRAASGNRELMQDFLNLADGYRIMRPRDAGAPVEPMGADGALKAVEAGVLTGEFTPGDYEAQKAAMQSVEVKPKTLLRQQFINVVDKLDPEKSRLPFGASLGEARNALRNIMEDKEVASTRGLGGHIVNFASPDTQMMGRFNLKDGLDGRIWHATHSSLKGAGYRVESPEKIQTAPLVVQTVRQADLTGTGYFSDGLTTGAHARFYLKAYEGPKGEPLYHTVVTNSKTGDFITQYSGPLENGASVSHAIVDAVGPRTPQTKETRAASFEAVVTDPEGYSIRHPGIGDTGTTNIASSAGDANPTSASIDTTGRGNVQEKIQQSETSTPDLFRAIKENPDGFTLDPATAEFVSKGWVVAPSKKTEFRIAKGDFTEETLGAYIDAMRPLIEAGAKIGGWLNKKDERFYLDAVHVVDNPKDAAILARDGQQLAVFHLDEFQEHETNQLLQREGISDGDAARPELRAIQRKYDQGTAGARILRTSDPAGSDSFGTSETGDPAAGLTGPEAKAFSALTGEPLQSEAVKPKSKSDQQDNEERIPFTYSAGNGRTNPARGRGSIERLFNALHDEGGSDQGAQTGVEKPAEVDREGNDRRGSKGTNAGDSRKDREAAHAADTARRLAELDSLYAYARDNGLVLVNPFFNRVANEKTRIGDGAEHTVFFHKPTGRVIKIVHEDEFNLGEVAQTEGAKDYVQSLMLNNLMLREHAGDLQFEGIVKIGGKPQVVISQEAVNGGKEATTKQIARDLKLRGFKFDGEGAWVHPLGVKMSDAVPNNVLVDKEGKLVYIDVYMQPTRPVSEIIKDLETDELLDSGQWEKFDESSLTFEEEQARLEKLLAANAGPVQSEAARLDSNEWEVQDNPFVPVFAPKVFNADERAATQALDRVRNTPEFANVAAALKEKTYFQETAKETTDLAHAYLAEHGDNYRDAFEQASSTPGVTPMQAIVIRGLVLKRVAKAENAAREAAATADPSRRADLLTLAEHYHEQVSYFGGKIADANSSWGQEGAAMRIIADSFAPQNYVRLYKDPVTKAQAAGLDNNPVAQEIVKGLGRARDRASTNTSTKMQAVFDRAAEFFVKKEAPGATPEEIAAAQEKARQCSSPLPVREQVKQAAVEEAVIQGMAAIENSMTEAQKNSREAQSFLKIWQTRLRTEAAAQLDAYIAERLKGGKVDEAPAPELTDEQKAAAKEDWINEAWRSVGDLTLAQGVFNSAREKILAENTPYSVLVDGAKFDLAKSQGIQKAVKASISLPQEIRKFLGGREQTINKLVAKLVEANPMLTETQATALADAVGATYNDLVEQAAKAELDALVKRSNNPAVRKALDNEGRFARLLSLSNMGAFNRQDAYQVLAPAFNLPAWDMDTARKLEEDATALQRLPEGSLARGEAGQRLMQDLTKAHVAAGGPGVKASYALKVLASGWIAHTLSGPVTHGVNLVWTQASILAEIISQANGYRIAAIKGGATEDQAQAFWGDIMRGYAYTFSKEAMGTSVRAFMEAERSASAGVNRFHTAKMDSLGVLENYKFDDRVADPTSKLMLALSNKDWKTAAEESANVVGGIAKTMAERAVTLDGKGAIKDLLATQKMVGRALLAQDAVNSQLARTMKVFMAQRYATLMEPKPEGVSQEAWDAKMSAKLDAIGREALQETKDKAIEQATGEEVLGGFGPKGTREFALNKARRVEQIIEQNTYGSDMLVNADSFAAHATYNNEFEGYYGLVSNLIFGPDARRAFGGLGVVLTPLQPFARVQSNIINQAISFSPYGFLRAENKSLSDIFLDKNSKFRRAPIEAGSPEYHALRSKALAGTVAIGAIGAMVAMAIKAAWDKDDKDKKEPAAFALHGTGPSDPALNKQWRQAGNIPYSLRVGKAVLRFQDIPEINLVLGALGEVHDRMIWDRKENMGDKSIAERVGNAMLGAIGVTTSRTLLSGLSDLAVGLSANASDAQRQAAFSKLADSYSTTLTNPGLAKFIQAAATGKTYEAKTFEGHLLQFIPFGGAIAGRPRLNILGEPITKGLYEQLFDRILPMVPTIHPVLTPLTEAGLRIQPPQTYAVVDPETKAVRPLSQEEYYRFSELYGRALASRLTPDMVRGLSEQAGRLPQNAQDRLDKIVLMARNRAQSELRGELGSRKASGADKRKQANGL